MTQNEIKEHFLKGCGRAGFQSPSSSATASQWLHSKSLHRTRLTQVLPGPFTFLLTSLAVKILNFVVISHCNAEETHIPKRAICQGDGINIRQYVFIFGVLCQSVAVAPCRDLRKSVSHTVLLLLSLLNKTNQKCSFPECKGTEERVDSKCSRCYCRGMWNVFSVRPWVFGPSILAVWKKYNKNKGSPAKENRHWLTWKKGVLLSLESRLQTLGFSLANWGEMVKSLQFWMYLSAKKLINFPTKANALLLKTRHSSVIQSHLCLIPLTQVRGTFHRTIPEDTASICSRGGLGWILGQIPSLKGLSSIEQAVQGSEVTTLEGFKGPVDVELGDMAKWWPWQCWGTVWDLGGLFQP